MAKLIKVEKPKKVEKVKKPEPVVKPKYTRTIASGKTLRGTRK